jgi:hypothetical protein
MAHLFVRRQAIAGMRVIALAQEGAGSAPYTRFVGFIDCPGPCSKIS